MERHFNICIKATNTGQCMDGLATLMRIGRRESCISRPTEELGKNEWDQVRDGGSRDEVVHGFAIHLPDITLHH